MPSSHDYENLLDLNDSLSPLSSLIVIHILPFSLSTRFIKPQTAAMRCTYVEAKDSRNVSAPDAYVVHYSGAPFKDTASPSFL